MKDLAHWREEQREGLKFSLWRWMVIHTLFVGTLSVVLLTFGTPSLLAVLGGMISGHSLEYFIHRFILHQRLWFPGAYKEHSGVHHKFFTKEFPTVDEQKDYYFVVNSPQKVLSILLIGAIVSLPISFLSVKIWVFWFGVMVLWYWAFEVLHLLSHSPLVMKSSILKVLVKGHLEHHDPKVMRTKNFTVVVPFWDIILRSSIPRSSEPRKTPL